VIAVDGFLVLDCGHFIHAGVAGKGLWQLGKLVNCDRCRTWVPIAVVTG
jgi:hypothetical protein